MRPYTFPGTTNALLVLIELIGPILPSLAQGSHGSSCVGSDDFSLLQVSTRPRHRSLQEKAFAGFHPAASDDSAYLPRDDDPAWIHPAASDDSTYLPRDNDPTWIHPAVSDDVTYLPRDDDDTWIPAEMSAESAPEQYRTASSLFDEAVERRLKSLDASIQSDKAVVASQYDGIPSIILGINDINNLTKSVAQTAQAAKNGFGQQTATPEAYAGTPQRLPGQSWAQPPAQNSYPAPPPAQPPPAPSAQKAATAPSSLSTMLQNPAIVAMLVVTMIIIIFCAAGKGGRPGAGDASV